MAANRGKAEDSAIKGDGVRIERQRTVGPKLDHRGVEAQRDNTQAKRITAKNSGDGKSCITDNKQPTSQVSNAQTF